MEGTRIFKSVSRSRLYHFGSVTTRKRKGIVRNNGKRTFLLKWKFSVEFFTKHYLKRGSVYTGPLNRPSKSIIYYFDYLISKFKYLIARFLK